MHIYSAPQIHLPDALGAMNTTLKKITPTLIAVILILIDYFLFPLPFIHPRAGYMLAFFVALSYMNDRILEFGVDGNPERFQVLYFTSMMLRMVFSVLFIFIFLWWGLAQKLLFILNFFIFYFLYIVFEIYYLLGILRSNGKVKQKL